MHIRDGFLSAGTCLATGAMAAGALAYAVHRVRRDGGSRAAPTMGVMAACLFAAQMMNFPIPGGTSGHLLGSVLVAAVLGPWAGAVVVTVVLTVQCFVFQDGGITALGANILNMAVLGSGVGFAIFDPVRRWVGHSTGIIVGAVLAAWISVMLSAAACSIELAIGGDFVLAPTMGTMLLVHSVIGVGEAIITGLALSFVVRTRPDMIYASDAESAALVRSGQVVIAGMSIALFVAVLLSPFASTLPDGLERSIARLGVRAHDDESVPSAPLAEYRVPGIRNIAIAGSVAGTIGTVAVFALSFALARGLRKSQDRTAAEQATLPS